MTPRQASVMHVPPARKRGAAAGLFGLVATLVLAGCTPPEPRLAGQRFGIDLPLSVSLPAEGGTRVNLPEAANRSLPIRLPAAQRNADWPQRGGNAAHAMPHLALAQATRPLWSATIGAGERRGRRITAAPVIDAGRLFAMDASGAVAALDLAGGALLWRADTTPRGGDGATAAPAGGGLAVASGRLFVATSAGELIAFDAASGGELWRKGFDAPLAGSPTVLGDLVLVQGRDATGWALGVADGRQRWVVSGIAQTTAIAAPAAPAAVPGLVVFALPGAVLAAARPDDGATLWISSVPGIRPGRAAALLRDVTGDPVVLGDRIYAGSSAGRTVAIDRASGQVLWVADEGAMGPAWPVADAVFLVSDTNRLVRLDAASGATVWVVPLPGYLREGERRAGMHSHFGPLLVGGRLAVASSDGEVRFFDPADGRQVGQIALPGGAASAPAVAGETLFVVSRNGQVHAFR